MDTFWILIIVTLSTSTWSFQSVESFRNDLALSTTTSTDCIWSNIESNKNGTGNPASFMLDCNLRTLNVDFWKNYTFNKDQIEHTSRVEIKCNDKLFFESFLTPNQSLFRLLNLKQIEISSCKIRKMYSRTWGSLGFLKNLSIRSQNGEWSKSVGLEMEAGSFEGLSQLETLDLSQNNIWSLPNKNIFCPLKSLLTLNLSRNSLSDIEELNIASSGTGRDLLSTIITTTTSGSNNGNNNNNNNNGYCALGVQNLDLSFNTLRRVGSNAFSRMRKLSFLRLQNNLVEEIEDFAFGGLGNMKLLNLSSNKLVAIPPSVFRFNPTLTEINLSNNSISALSPQVFSGLESLRSLDLSRNLLTSQWVKDKMFNNLFRLVILKLSSNQLSYIDGTIFKDLGSLQGLYLDNNRIESINPQAFSFLSKLLILDLTNNRLSIIDSRLFSRLFNLKSLYLDHNKIKTMDPDSLRNTSLQDLGLADNLLQEVPVALSGLSQLVTLDIGENRIEKVNNNSFAGMGNLYGLRIVENKIVELPSGFCNPLKKLRVLNLSQNRIQKISSEAFKACPEVRALRLDGNSLEELQEFSPQLPSLLWLNVSQNRLRSSVDYHDLPKTIEWLDLSYNSLETLGGPSPPGVVDPPGSSTYHLRVLDASHNQITHLDYTTVPPTLETLRLNNNRLRSVAQDTFRSSRLIRVEMKMNQLENLPLSSLRFPPVPIGKPLPEFYLADNPFKATCDMEWLTRVNQFTVLRNHPRIVDLDSILLKTKNQVAPLVDMRPKDFLCPYKSHCFALCLCCEFDACDCEMTCPGNCSCYHDTAWSSNIVECSNLNYEDIPARIPMDATELYLDGNRIFELGNHIFIGKKNLRVLYLNDSHVEFIRNKTFNGLKKLEVLRLEDNLLTELHGNEFTNLESLKELYLQNNLLRYIAPSTFSNLKYLEVLRLDANLLVDFNVWALSGNGYLSSVQLAGNPWSCDCEYLIPFRSWVSKTAIVVDFSLTSCEDVNSTHVLTGISSTDEMNHYPESDGHSNNHHAVIPKTHASSSDSKLYPIQVHHPISSMCNQNPELNFNFNSVSQLSEILNNHISAMAGGAEKVTIPHPGDQEIQFTSVPSTDSTTNTIWTLILILTALIVLVLVIVVIFRKEIYYWVYTRVFANNDGGGLGRGTTTTSYGVAFPFPSIIFPSCCGQKVGNKKSRSSGDGVGGGDNGDDCDKLFDAYFIYSHQDEDILVQKIAPELESQQGPPYFRLCLHYRDLCLNPDNPWNTDMILSACDASKRVVLVLSRTFLQSELTHPTFRQAIQSAINRHQKKLILVLLPPFSEQNLGTIYPELNSSVLKLEWSEKNFISKLKLILPTPTTLISSNNTHGRRGSSLLISSQAPPPLIDLHVGHTGNSSTNSNASGTISNYTINRLEFPYSSQHQYHRNILPYQIPLSNCSTLTTSGSAAPPPVPTHHIALTTQFYNHHQSQPAQMNHYNGSQCSSSNGQYYPGIASNGGGNNMQNFIHIPGRPSSNSGAVVYPMSTLPHPQPHSQMQQNFSFNESFRRHLQQKHKTLQQQHQGQTPVLQFVRQQNQTGTTGHHHQQYHHHQPTSGNNSNAYQPLEANYSSTSAISSSAEELEHVYSTLDSPMQSPNSVNTTSTNVNNSLNSDCNSSGVGNNNTTATINSPGMLNETTGALNVSSACNNESANNLSLVSPRNGYNNNSGRGPNPISNTCNNSTNTNNNTKRNSSRNNNNLNKFSSQNGNSNVNRSELLPGQNQSNQGPGPAEGHGQLGNNGQMYFV